MLLIKEITPEAKKIQNIKVIPKIINWVLVPAFIPLFFFGAMFIFVFLAWLLLFNSSWTTGVIVVGVTSFVLGASMFSLLSSCFKSSLLSFKIIPPYLIFVFYYNIFLRKWKDFLKKLKSKNK